MKIKSAEFVTSSTSWTDCPPPSLPEYGFIGRSNVGKSSLINILTDRKKLAKTSATPGKTQLINHFLINERWYLVDLPGYGWARVSKKQRQSWKKMIYSYLENRENLSCVFVLIDIRHEAQTSDLDLINWLGHNQIPLALVFTKTDKVKKLQLEQNLSAYKKKLKENWELLPEIFQSSAVNKSGKNEILNYIESINL